MSSLLDNVENTLQYGDVEMLRKELNEKIDRLELLLYCKADVNYIDTMQCRINELEYKNKEIFEEFKKIYEKISGFAILVKELTDTESKNNIPVEYINGRHKDLLQMCDNFSRDFYERSEIVYSKSY